MKDGYKLLVLFDPHIQTKPDGRGGWKGNTSKALRTALNFGSWWNPDETIIGHDFMEFGPISYWEQKNRLSMEGRRLAHDFEYANRILDEIGYFSKNITYQPGNHDEWMNKYIQDKPELEGILNVAEMLHFDERGIKSLPYGGVYRVGKAAFAHEMLRNRKTFTTKYHAARFAEDYGRSIFYGHFHTFQGFTRVTYDSKPNIAVGIGCLCTLNPGWLRQSPNSWVHQLLFMEFDAKGHFSWYAPIMINYKFAFHGKVFGPEEDE